MLPEDLKHRAEQAAHSEGLSLAELIRTSLEERLQKPDERDPFFADESVFPEKPQGAAQRSLIKGW